MKSNSEQNVLKFLHNDESIVEMGDAANQSELNINLRPTINESFCRDVLLEVPELSSRSPMMMDESMSQPSRDVLMNMQIYEEYQILEIKNRYEEELHKNELLERKLRNLEFEHLRKQNESNRKIQDLELKNANLELQLRQTETSATHRETSLTDYQLRKSFESKISLYETEILSLREREADLLNQICTIKQQNLDLRLQSERVSFMAQTNLRAPGSQRVTQTSCGKRGPNFMKSINDQVNSRSSSKSLISDHQIRSSPGAKEGDDLSSMIKDMTQTLLKVNAEKDALEQELQIVKDKAMCQLLSKEKQMVEMIKLNEKTHEDLKKENQRLLNEVHSKRKCERQLDSYENQQVRKLERENQKLQQEVSQYDEKYAKLHQKYLEDKMQAEKEAAYLNDKYHKDIHYYQDKADKQKEKLKIMVSENEKLKSKLLQSQDFKQEIIKELEEHEQRLRDAENEKIQLEKDFQYRLNLKNETIQDMTARIHELQDTIFSYDSAQQTAIASEQVKFEKKLNEMHDEAASYQIRCNDLEVYSEELLKELEKEKDQNKEMHDKISLWNEVIEQMQKEQADIESSYKSKIEGLTSQIEELTMYYERELNAVKLKNQMSDQFKRESLTSLKEVDECYEEDGAFDQTKQQVQAMSRSFTETTATSSLLRPARPSGESSKEKKNIFNKDRNKPQGVSLKDEMRSSGSSMQRSSNSSQNSSQYLQQQQQQQQLQQQIQQKRLQKEYGYTPRSSEMLIQQDDIFQRISTQSNVNDFEFRISGGVYRNSDQINLQKMHEQMLEAKNLNVELQSQLDEKIAELEEAYSQIEHYESQIETMKQSKADLISEKDAKLKSVQEYAKKILAQLHEMRAKCNEDQLLYQQQLAVSQNLLSSEILQLRRKLKRLESENDDLNEQVVLVKQESSSEVNHLKIQITAIEDELMQSKLRFSNVAMEKDMMMLRFSEHQKYLTYIKGYIEASKDFNQQRLLKMIELGGKFGDLSNPRPYAAPRGSTMRPTETPTGYHVQINMRMTTSGKNYQK